MVAIDQKKIQAYLRFAARCGTSSLFPKGSIDINVSNLRTHYNWNTNDVVSFMLTFKLDGSKQQHKLFLKRYPLNFDPTTIDYFNEEDHRKYIREFQTIRSLSNIGFPVPRVYCCETDSFFLGSPFIIMRDEETLQQPAIITERANILARLHNLDVEELAIDALRIPNDPALFAERWLNHYKYLLSVTRHYRRLKKNFDSALRWLQTNKIDNFCPKYSLIHGDYNPDHVLITKDSRPIVIDWERVNIGDPAYDVAYAYHWIKSGLFNNERSPDLGNTAAEHFLLEYQKQFEGNISNRLEFYKVLSLLGLAIVFSNYLSNPAEVRRRFGGTKSLFVFPFLRFPLVARKWVSTDFPIFYLRYSRDFFERRIKDI